MFGGWPMAPLGAMSGRSGGGTHPGITRLRNKVFSAALKKQETPQAELPELEADLSKSGIIQAKGE